jgi:hypothetical protein
MEQIEIRVKGKIYEGWSDWFNNFNVSRATLE